MHFEVCWGSVCTHECTCTRTHRHMLPVHFFEISLNLPSAQGMGMDPGIRTFPWPWGLVQEWVWHGYGCLPFDLEFSLHPSLLCCTSRVWPVWTSLVSCSIFWLLVRFCCFQTGERAEEGRRARGSHTFGMSLLQPSTRGCSSWQHFLLPDLQIINPSVWPQSASGPCGFPTFCLVILEWSLN